VGYDVSMRRPWTWGLALACVGCGATIANTSTSDGNGTDGNPQDDAAIDAEVLGAWAPPAKISVAAATGLDEDDGTLSYSGLELVFAVVNAADADRKDLYYASRPDLLSQFGPATKLPFSVNGTSEETPRFSTDDKTLFFAKTVANRGLDIHQVTRPAAGSQMWGTPTLVAGVSSAGTDKWFMPCTGNRYLMIVGGDIAEGTLGGGPPTPVAELSSAQNETGPWLTDDCLTVFFASARPDGNNVHLYTSQRTAIGSPFSAPTLVTDFAMLGGDQQDPFIAPNNRTFVFASNAGGTNDIYISTR
jgi:WD40-like Beta Propeller Repeat